MNRTPWLLRQPEPPLRGEILHPFSFAPHGRGLCIHRLAAQAARQPQVQSSWGAGRSRSSAPGRCRLQAMNMRIASGALRLFTALNPRLSGSGMRRSWISVSPAGRRIQRMPSRGRIWPRAAGTSSRIMDRTLARWRPAAQPRGARVSGRYRAMSTDSITVSDRGGLGERAHRRRYARSCERLFGRLADTRTNVL